MTLLRQKQIESIGGPSSGGPTMLNGNANQPFRPMNGPVIFTELKTLTSSDAAIVGTKNGLPRASFVLHITDNRTATGNYIVPNGLQNAVIFVQASRISLDGGVEHLTIAHHRVVNEAKSLLIDVMDSNNSVLGAKLALGNVNLSPIPVINTPNAPGTLEFGRNYDYIHYDNGTLRTYLDTNGRFFTVVPPDDTVVGDGSQVSATTSNTYAFADSANPRYAGAGISNLGIAGQGNLANIEGLEFSDFIPGNISISVLIIASNGVIL